MENITLGTEIALGTNLNEREVEIINEFVETFDEYIMMQTSPMTYLLNHETCDSVAADLMTAWLENHNLEYSFQ